MLSLIGIIGFLFVTCLIGKRTKQLGFVKYVLIGLITAAQVCIVLYDMYTLEWPLR